MTHTEAKALKLAKSWFEANTYGDEAVEVYEAIEQALAAQPAPVQEPALKPLSKKWRWVLHESFADVAGFDEDGIPSFYWQESVTKFKSGELSVPCKGKNCGSMNGWLHSAECRAEHEAQYTTPPAPAVQEPWKYRRWNDEAEKWELTDDCGWPSDPVYTTQPAAQPAVPLTDDQIRGLTPKPDGVAEGNVRRVEVLPGVMGTEFDEVDAWSMPLVLQIARAIEAAHGITEKGQP